MKPSPSLLALIAAALTPAMLTAGPAMSSPTTSSGQTAKLALSRSNLGSILVDNRGRTLYLFEKDKRGKSSCYGACATYWPPLLTRGTPAAEGGVKQSLLGVTRRASGVTQVTYAGHPLYRFAGDAKPGQTSGQNSHAFGADWYVVSSAGKKIEKASR
jgi:predicted lipoprotein with Yx(FWY)xxD motif